jgi:hypothetical protein
MKDPRMKKYVSGFAVHWYADSSSTDFLTSFLDKAHHQYPDKFILYTEASISKYIYIYIYFLNFILQSYFKMQNSVSKNDDLD